MYTSLAEEDLVEEDDVLVEVLLGFAEDPLLEVDEVEALVWQPVAVEPLNVVLEVGFGFGGVEDAVDHVAAEQPHLDLVLQVALDGLVLMY